MSASHGGKGSGPRPISVSKKEFGDNWEKAFGKKDVADIPKVKIEEYYLYRLENAMNEDPSAIREILVSARSYTEAGTINPSGYIYSGRKDEYDNNWCAARDLIITRLYASPYQFAGVLQIKRSNPFVNIPAGERYP